MPATLRIVIEDEEGRRQVVPFDGEQITLGRGHDGSRVRLPDRNVSRRHARFLLANGAVFLEDLGSANGTRVNGERIGSRRRIREGDLVQIGDYDIALEGSVERVRDDRPTAEFPAPAPAAPPARPAAPQVSAPPPPRLRMGRALFLGGVAVASLLLGFAAGRLGNRARPAAPPAAAAQR